MNDLKPPSSFARPSDSSSNQPSARSADHSADHSAERLADDQLDQLADRQSDRLADHKSNLHDDSRDCAADRIDARFLGAVVVVFIAAALRIVPHPPNFSPISAMALFGGVYLSRKGWALALPLAAMIFSDAVLGFHDQMPVVYGAFVLVTLIGFALRSKPSAGRIALASVSGSVVFFLITNFAVWAKSGMYEKSAHGLAECFVAALPFFQNALTGDLLYSAVLFGGWALAALAVPQLREA
jgi:hypothetical protein